MVGVERAHYIYACDVYRTNSLIKVNNDYVSKPATKCHKTGITRIIIVLPVWENSKDELKSFSEVIHHLITSYS